MRGDFLLEIGDIFDFLEEQAVDLRQPVQIGQGRSSADQLCQRVKAVVPPFPDVFFQLALRVTVELSGMNVVYADFQRADRFQQAFLNGAPHAHHLARRLHLRGKAVGHGVEFI